MVKTKKPLQKSMGELSGEKDTSYKLIEVIVRRLLHVTFAKVIKLILKVYGLYCI